VASNFALPSRAYPPTSLSRKCRTRFPTTDDRVRWILQSDGSVVAEAFAYRLQGVNTLNLQANDPAGGSFPVQISLQHDNAILLRAHLAAKTLLAVDGTSEFFTRAGGFAGIAQIDAGGGAMNFPGTATGTPVSVSHSLGVTPDIALITFRNVIPAAAQPVGGVVSASTNASVITFNGFTVNGGAIGPGNVTFNWIAIKL
jgi:hypothetical protein